MTDLVFYEKPGCAGNQRQKKLLLGLGHRLQVRDLLSEKWTAERLRPFFGKSPVAQWFNESAHRVKDGSIDIHAVDEKQALELMLAEPLLIRRPLMQFGEVRQSGFLPGPVLEALGISLDPEKDLQSCPMPEPSAECNEVE
jgi:nitrogenase-associated protein